MSRRPVARLFKITSALLFIAALAVGWAIHSVPAFGPWLANTVRAIAGPELVALAEDYYYGAFDSFQRWRYADAPPASMFDAPVLSDAAGVAPPSIATVTGAPSGVAGAQATPAATPVEAGVSVPATKTEPAPVVFRPKDFKPPVPRFAARGDGRWQVWESGPAGSPQLIYRTQVHPDPQRTQAVVAVIAIDLRNVEMNLVPGTHEPVSDALPPGGNRRPGVIPLDDRGGVIAAFNGGWQAVHGHLGMKVGDIELLPPVERGCSIAMLNDGSFRMGSWASLKKDYAHVRWFRQTPPCLVENGREDPRLDDGGIRWGAALGGNTVVRRSGLGVDAAHETLYYAIGDSLTSGAIARALVAAGAVTVAMLDVNYSFPRFVTFRDPVAKAAWLDTLPKDPSPPTGQYLSSPAPKDFFYLKPKKTLVSQVAQ